MKTNLFDSRATSKFRALTSLEQVEFESLLDFFSERVERKLRTTTLKGVKRVLNSYQERSNSSLKGSRRKLEFLLTYLKENPNQEFHGHIFNLSQSKVSEWVSFLLPVLEETLEQINVSPKIGYEFNLKDEDEDYVLVDVTENQVPRKVDYKSQEEEYSGKKKLHTMKQLAIVNTNLKVLYLSPSYPGSVHDKTIWDDIEVDVKGINILMDLGFLGAERTHENVILPFKKPKNGELTDLQEKINHEISKVRVKVEHAFAGIKTLKIVRNKIRLKYFEVRERVMKVATGLHNLRRSFRSLQT